TTCSGEDPKNLLLTRFFPRKPVSQAHSTRVSHRRPLTRRLPGWGRRPVSPGHSWRNPMHVDSRKSARFQPTLASLESRAVPSATATVLGSKLDITCDDAGSLVQIRDNGKGDVTAWVKSASGTVTVAGSGINDISVHGKAGNDTVDFRTTGNLIHALTVHEDLGAGNDYSYSDLYNGISGVPLTLDLSAGA